MERIWLQHYPPGVPAEIDVAKYSSLVALLEESFARYRDRTAFVCMDKAMTYGDLDEMSRAFGAWLQSKGLRKGARVAIMMPNVLQYPVIIVGILRAGYTVVNTNPLYVPRELQHQLKDSGAEAIVVLENFAHTLEKVITNTDVKHVVVASMGDLLGMMKGTIVNLIVRWAKKMVPAYALPGATWFNAAIAAGKGMSLSEPQVGPDDVALLQYTGGTTGLAKGAILLNRNVVGNMLQIDAWLQPVLDKEPRIDRLTVMAALPLYHIFAFTACFLLSIHTGGLCILIPNPRDIPNLIKELAKREVNHFPAVNTLYNALLDHPDFGSIDWSLLKCAVGGGMAVQQTVAERWLKATGCPVVEGYGMSETSPVLTCNSPHTTEWNGTIGLPMPSTDIFIRDDDDNDVPLGEIGEICARGPQVMPGYWQLPDETAAVMTHDGCFRTGDIGVMDATGNVRIVDRKKDMITVSGFKVYPSEVEAVASDHPGVFECAAIGVPDARSGEIVKLFVVKKDLRLTEAELLAHCRTELTPYKVPKSVEFRTELPKTNVGKILRRELRDEPQKIDARA
ncbi:long-chain-fatty-acid--CoA ligase [Rhizobium mesoamericanum]|uniref:Long-chain-fatty-acid--CoA ligase n=1 Tax=Rhizobium mesoamericanum STM3625 TaxID=1211777 RepID=K0Q697_9HYPH|nr:long-chain-fatty-acid--CoA ligase [Rhizobium mesoamericanum]CCM79479.1 acyl-CoA synthetase (long-chain-fatty-acid--CoA ligase) [Rhizobium mesoamericanum STM3625]